MFRIKKLTEAGSRLVAVRVGRRRTGMTSNEYKGFLRVMENLKLVVMVI